MINFIHHEYDLELTYYKYCSIKSTGLINCTGFLLGVLVLDFRKVLTSKRTVSIKSTGLINCTGLLLRQLYASITCTDFEEYFKSGSLILFQVSPYFFGLIIRVSIFLFNLMPSSAPCLHMIKRLTLPIYVLANVIFKKEKSLF